MYFKLFAIAFIMNTCAWLPQGDAQDSVVYNNCAEVTRYGKPSGVYQLRNPNYFGSSSNFFATCDTKTWGGGWMVIQRRMDGSVKFNRGWGTYVSGFGDIDGDHWLGLDKISAFLVSSSQQLLVLLEDNDGVEAYEFYDKFAITGSSENYSLNTLGKANGTAGDSLRSHHGQSFKTRDRDNDQNCGKSHDSGWWFSSSCHESNLNGDYNNKTHGMGVNWSTFRGYNESLKSAVMMIRPRDF